MLRPITKSDYLAGVQCPLRLWNRHHAPIPYGQRAETPAMRTGMSVGQLAHRLFPGGVLVEAEPWERDKSITQTRDLLADPSIPAIFEAGFVYDGLHTRGEVKEQHIPDLAFQVYVVRGSGFEIAEAGIIHINKEHVRGAELDVSGLFTRSDETARVKQYLATIDEHVARQKNILLRTAPVLEPGTHCHDPYPCEFWERCTAKMPDDWIFYLPRLHDDRYEELQSRGIVSISAISADFELSEVQARIREVLQSGKPYIGPGLTDALAGIGPPVSYLDFETLNSAIPLWPGTHPFQRIPFQWSLHRITESGTLTHAEFLADALSDPRRAVAESLVEHLCPSDERIVVYNRAFEASVLSELADLYGDLASKLLGIADRIWDLLPVVRNHVYLPEFGGSFSIKKVAPALASEINYAGLNDVRDGTAASYAFVRLAMRDFGDSESENELRRSLLQYCHLDTLAMVEIHRALRRFAAPSF
jgi:uncharacterized protein DUF2779